MDYFTQMIISWELISIEHFIMIVILNKVLKMRNLESN